MADALFSRPHRPNLDWCWAIPSVLARRGAGISKGGALSTAQLHKP